MKHDGWRTRTPEERERALVARQLRRKATRVELRRDPVTHLFAGIVLVMVAFILGTLAVAGDLTLFIIAPMLVAGAILILR